MIARLHGTVVHLETGRCVLDVAGVGYEVHAPGRCLEAWRALGDQAVVAWISTQVREDSITLYGFDEPSDRDAFKVLLSVTGVGPKMALAAIDALGVDHLVAAVEREDLTALCKIPGVGRKTAKRLALELKGKLKPGFVVSARAPAAPAGPPDPLPLALARLDYGKSEIDKALQALSAEGLTPEAPLEQRLRAALRVLSG